MSEENQTPSWLLALGKELPPAQIEVRNQEYRLEKIFKHDFFAYTALYGGASGRVVLKIGRKASVFGLPLFWIGWLHSWHESAVFSDLEDIDTVPEFMGRFGRYGLVHDYIDGHELARGERVPDDFFERLKAGLEEVHRRGMAYVDLEKPENVLVGVDGSPYLFDFQISYRWPFKRGQTLPPFRWILASLQASDLYHLSKLQRRCRPDTMTKAERKASKLRPWHLRIWGSITRPITHLRRRFLNRIDPVKLHGRERGRQK
jgi:hypothetical protein